MRLDVMLATAPESNVTTHEMQQVTDTNASAASRAARPSRVDAASRRRFSISASRSMLGHAQSSPMVSGATAWKLLRKRTSLGRSSRLSLWRMSSSASA